MSEVLDTASHTSLPGSGRVAKDRYVSATFATLERERLWPRVWLHAAALDAVPRPGCFVRVDLAGADVLVVRGKDDVVRAFYNVCQHRGRRLVDAVRGEARTLRCPLHHWQWTTEGESCRIPGREVFGSLIDPPPGLSPLVCETWGGQAWVHLGTPEQSLVAWLAPMVKALAHYDLGDYALDEYASYDVPCNWKVAADQFNEAYHVRSVHPYLLGAIDDTSVRDAAHGPHVHSSFNIGTPTPGPDQGGGISPALAELLTANNVDLASLGGDPSRAAEALRRGMRARGIVRLSDQELLACQNWGVFPSLRWSVYAHMMQLDRYRPHPSDPQRSWLDQLTFLRLRPGEARPTPRYVGYTFTGEDADGRPLFADGARVPRVMEDDVREMVALQHGIQSPGFGALRLGGHERRILHMHDTIDRYIARSPEGPRLTEDPLLPG